MLDRGEPAKYAASVFYQLYNDFDIYVEDTAEGYVKIFANLLGRAINSNVTLDRVFPLGPRSVVISAARVNLESATSRKAVFLVDGDLHLLSGETEELPNNTIVLPRYCIENFLYDEQALISVLDEEAPNLSVEKIREKFDYSGWLQRSSNPLRKLFIVFATAKHLKSSLKTVGHSYSKFCANNFGEIDCAKASTFAELLFAELVSVHGELAVTEARSTVLARINGDLCFISTYVSAKDFSLPLLVIRMKSISGTKTSNINLKMRFSKVCSVESLSSVESPRISRRPVGLSQVQTAA
jgi:Protein of unknown function (DUF4435)